MSSVHYRGTVEIPGLVLALDASPADHCDGAAFRVAPELADETLATLRARELISYAYHEVTISITLADGTDVDAVTYVINREGAQYCGNLDLETQATIIARAHGTRGPNRDYLFATVDHLAEMGVDDQDLRALARMVQALPE
jgi:cation transport protein ChaC